MHKYSTLQVSDLRKTADIHDFCSDCVLKLNTEAPTQGQDLSIAPRRLSLSSQTKNHTPKIPMGATGKFKTKLDQGLHASTKIHCPLFRLLTKQAAPQGSRRSFGPPDKTSRQRDHGHNHCTIKPSLQNTAGVSWERQNIQIGVIPSFKNRRKRSKSTGAYSGGRLSASKASRPLQPMSQLPTDTTRYYPQTHTQGAKGTVTYNPLPFERRTTRHRTGEFCRSDNSPDKAGCRTPARGKQICFWPGPQP